MSSIDTAEHRRGRVPHAVRRQQVLGLAEELFAEGGYTAASMDELARRAGVSKPMVYNLVGSKEAVFRTCMDRQADELAGRVAEAVAGEPDLGAVLAKGGQAWFEYIADHRVLWNALLGGIDGPMSTEITRIRQRQGEVVAAILVDRAYPSGRGVPRVLVEAVAHFVNGGFEALARWWADRPELTPRALARLATETLLPGLEAVLAAPPPGWRAPAVISRRRRP